QKREAPMFKKLLIAVAAAANLGAFMFAGAAHADLGQQSGAAPTAVVQSGSFEGLSDHVTKGGVSILHTASGYVAVLEGDFSLDGAPSPTLGFGKNGFVKETEFTKLESKKGLQVYAIPASINPADYDEFYVWCAKFSVPLGVASLTSAQ
ncbi:MAG: DM13 domain-containing protein, partial [Pseudomonadota bacterium]